MKMYEIHEMSVIEIKKRIEEEGQNLSDLRFQNELKNLTNTAKLDLVKKDIAKMKTVLKQKESKVQKADKE